MPGQWNDDDWELTIYVDREKLIANAVQYEDGTPFETVAAAAAAILRTAAEMSPDGFELALDVIRRMAMTTRFHPPCGDDDGEDAGGDTAMADFVNPNETADQERVRKLSSIESGLTPREVEFVEGVSRQVANGRSLSVKQQQWADSILRKHGL